MGIISRFGVFRHSLYSSVQLHPGWYWAQNWAQGITPSKKEFFLWGGTPLPFPFQRMLWDSGENAHTKFFTFGCPTSEDLDGEFSEEIAQACVIACLKQLTLQVREGFGAVTEESGPSDAARCPISL